MGKSNVMKYGNPVDDIRTNKNAKTINEFNMALFNLPPIDKYDEDQFIQRVNEYFTLVNHYNMKPTLTGLGLAFNTTRSTIYKWCNGVDSDFLSTNCRALLKKCYALINTSMEDYLLNGQINPVAGIFLMKNNFNYKDQTEVLQTTTTVEGASSDELIQKYDVIDADFKEVE